MILLKTMGVVFGLWLAGGVVFAEESFRYSVSDTAKNDRLDYDMNHELRVDVLSGELPQFLFYTKYRIRGCKQDSFTYTVQTADQTLAPARYEKFLASVRKLPLKALNVDAKDAPPRTDGSVNIDGKTYLISASLDQPARAKLDALILQFEDETVPKAGRKIVTRTIEGDLHPAQPAWISEVLRDPKKYDGKRVRLVGYYSGKLEVQSFSGMKGAELKESLWMGELSSFAKLGAIPNETYLSVEGTFDAAGDDAWGASQKGIGPGHRGAGHMGMWPGELNRITQAEGRDKAGAGGK